MTLMSHVRIPQFPAAGAIALRFAPLWPLSLVGARLATRLAERHPALFSRLGEQAIKVFLIDPTDLPLVFVLKPRPARPSLFAAQAGRGGRLERAHRRAIGRADRPGARRL